VTPPPTIVSADPEGAATKLREHLDAVWATERPARERWRRFPLDDLRWVVVMTARASTGATKQYFVRLDGRRYDQWPPEVQFVEPERWEPVGGGRWWPVLDPLGDPERPRWFELDPDRELHDGERRPLVGCAYSLGAYEADHALDLDDFWIQGKHTVADTLAALAEMLAPPYYQGVDR
jgi:hypothetical protein